MKCAGCKYWGEDNDEYRALYGTKRCGKAIQMWDAGDWTWNDETLDRNYSLKPIFINQMAFVADGSDYRADLFTKADFFCAHFEDKTETAP